MCAQNIFKTNIELNEFQDMYDHIIKTQIG